MGSAALRDAIKSINEWGLSEGAQSGRRGS